MEGVAAASGIIAVAQFGLQFSQVLITVIGDYRDAAKNINRLRDEIHLASICLKRLGDLDSQNLLRNYGILEATNLRERCQAVFWEIRSTIRKDDTPLHPTTITKDQIDVSKFQGVRWALWTKSGLESPRQELDRLKDSMTLCFVSHMAILATTDLERNQYASQIPGIKRSLAWSEKNPDDDYFRKRLKDVGVSDDKIARILGDDVVDAPPAERDPDKDDSQTPVTTRPTETPVEQSPSRSNSRPSNASGPAQTPNAPKPNPPVDKPMLKAWSIDPPARTSEIMVSQDWMRRYIEEGDIGDKNILRVQSKLHPWFKNELDLIFQEQSRDPTHNWSVVSLKPVFKHRFSRGPPQSVQVVMQSSPKPPSEFDLLIRQRALKAGWAEEYVDELIGMPSSGKDRHRHQHRHRSPSYDHQDLVVVNNREGAIVDSERPTWIRIERKHILPETLDAYKLNWEYGTDDDFIIKQYIDHELQKELFAHTRKIIASRGTAAEGDIEEVITLEKSDGTIPRKEKADVEHETDEEIIAKQLALYQ